MGDEQQTQNLPATQQSPAAPLAIVSQDTDIGKYIAAEVQSEGQSPADASAVLTFFKDHAIRTRDARWALVLSVILTGGFALARTQIKNNKIATSPYWFIPLGALVIGTAYKFYSLNTKESELTSVFATLISSAPR